MILSISLLNLKRVGEVRRLQKLLKPPMEMFRSWRISKEDVEVVGVGVGVGSLLLQSDIWQWVTLCLSYFEGIQRRKEMIR